METKTISEINEYVGTSINPLDTPDELFELYSVPSYDNQYPEIIKGSAIGSTKITVQENDVLICKINPRINRVWIVKHNTSHRLLASSEWIVVRNSSINPRYLQSYFSSPAFRDKITSQVAGIGGSLTRAQPKVVANYSVPIPPIQKQNEVANSMDQLGHLISLRKKQLQKLDDLVKARFVEMFGDPVSNPKAWPVRPFLDMGDCKNGMNFHYDDSGVDLHCVGVGDFQNHSIIEDTSTLSMVSLNELPSDDYMLRDDDIVFVRSNGNKALVGRCVAVYPGDVPTTFSGFCIRYRKRDEGVTVPYLLRVLKTDSMRAKMAGRGANIQNLNQQILGTLIIPVPPLALQDHFAAFVSQVDKSKLSIQQGLEKLETLKKSLMQQYFG